MKKLEEIVGAAVRDLADDAPVQFDLAAAARTQGRRIRRRRRMTMGSAALALVLAAAAPFVVFRPEREVLPAAPTPAPSAVDEDWRKQPVELPGGMIVTALAGKGENVMLDRLAGGYRTIPARYTTVWGSPAGTGAAVVDENDHLQVLTGPGSSLGTSVESYVSEPQWSPDGTRLLITGPKNYTVWNTSRDTFLSSQKVPAQSRCSEHCFFTWLPNGEEIAIATDYRIVVLRADTGEEQRMLPVQGAPIGPGAWSADGEFVIVFNSEGDHLPKHVVAVRTGTVVGAITGDNLHFLPDGRILSIQDSTAVVYDAKGVTLETRALPADFAGRTVSVGRP